MAEVTPAAQELADEKGLDLSTVEGSGKDGRVLLEDVEALLEAEAPEEAEEAPEEEAAPADEVEAGEDVGELTEPESSERSVEAFDEHPHAPEEPNVELEQSEAEEAVLEAEDSDEEEEEEEGDEELLSTDSILSRGLREKGFYIIPEQGNPNAPHPNAAPEEEEEEVSDED